MATRVSEHTTGAYLVDPVAVVGVPVPEVGVEPAQDMDPQRHCTLHAVLRNLLQQALIEAIKHILKAFCGRPQNWMRTRPH